jgi:DNA-binding transcriptional ArsR family regulator
MADESVFRAVAHATRRRVLDLLRVRERSVAELFASFRISRQAFSQHLRILRTAGLVRQRRAGRNRVYAIEAGRLRAVRQWILGYDTTPGQ